jgi:methionine-gamma-lyase
MASVARTPLAHLWPGDVLLHREPIYRGADHLICHFLTEFGVRRIGIPAEGETEALEEAVARPEVGRNTRMAFVETPANPTNALVDIDYLVRDSRRLGGASGDRGGGQHLSGALGRRPLSPGRGVGPLSSTR